MAPLTRMRSDPGDIPSDLMVEYYSQRASKGGLIVSEATPVFDPRFTATPGAPGIYSDRQIDGWRRVTDAVHAKGGRIFLQLWHVGRQSHTDLQPNGEPPVAPSAIVAEGYAYTRQGEVPFSMPRRASRWKRFLASSRSSAPAPSARCRLASTAWRSMARNGYLPDQFPARRHQQTHRRIWRLNRKPRAIPAGGDAGCDFRLGCRSRRRPYRGRAAVYGSMSDSDPAATFGYVATELDRLGIAYLHVVEPRIKGIEGDRQGPGSDRSPASSAKIPPHPDRGGRFHR